MQPSRLTFTPRKPIHTQIIRTRVIVIHTRLNPGLFCEVPESHITDLWTTYIEVQWAVATVRSRVISDWT